VASASSSSDKAESAGRRACDGFDLADPRFARLYRQVQQLGLKLQYITPVELPIDSLTTTHEVDQ